ncbi:hypothetical protein SAMN04488541_105614 [Thermoflexibacter ruber]|uniref:Uncharacterized protein n=1 Tax=Thermoflexibacter ruber TaxID=1003 RepID=A0A1I2JNS8_9BACT|nr:hypothetical protein SAMN04488541_105610 [Thermoflexibacter ruber]SFF55580.1 hypothetical protein SAMN04488541_105614 [Thermoflexibacter ruber]
MFNLYEVLGSQQRITMLEFEKEKLRSYLGVGAE